MASRAEIEQLAKMALSDADFRAQLVADPEKAAGSIGIKLTAEQVERAKKEGASVLAALEKGDMGSVDMRLYSWG